MFAMMWPLSSLYFYQISLSAPFANMIGIPLSGVHVQLGILSGIIAAIPGIELTHVPAQAIAETARNAKELGAWLVVVHGETLVEPVEKGTNLAAVSSPHVDILAHPGLLTLEEALLAARKGIFIELSARKGHCLANGHVVRVALQARAKLLLNSDAHDDADLLTSPFAVAIATGAGLDEADIKTVLNDNPQQLLARMPALSPK